MPKDKNSGKKLADMMYGNPEGAAFGVFPQMKPKRSKQDPEAAKNFPVDLARGVLAGAVGMPGDIESLARLPYELITGNESPTFLPTSEDVLKRIPFGSDTPASQFASGLGTLAGGSANLGAVPRAVKKGALAAGRAGERMAEKVVPQIMERGGAGADILSGLAQGSQSRVIKPKGGNWLGGNFAGYIDPSISRLMPYGGLEETLERAKKSLVNMEDKAKSFNPRDIQAQRDIVADLESKVAVENWVTRNLGNYVKKQMGTPEDPVRALHEQGITHLGGGIDDLSPVADQSLRQRRAEAGFPAEGMGQSEMARKYENLTDDAISSMTAGDVQKSSKALSDAQQAERAVLDYEPILNQNFLDHLKSKGLSDSEIKTLSYKTPLRNKAYILGDEKYGQLEEDFYLKNKSLDRNALGAAQTNPWIEKLAPETELYSGYVSDLGFDHVVDVLKQDVQSGRIRPEQLNKVSMEQAVRRTYEYDQEMAKKMREAQIKATEGFPTYKEYPKGYRWIELAKPADLSDLPEGYRAEPYKSQYSEGVKIIGPDGKQAAAGDTLDEAIKNMSETRLEEALKYEGDTMGHCVGGYCPDVLEGRTRIFSLRDAKGEPHVTVEVQPAYRNRGFREGEKPTGDEYYQLQEQYVQGQKTGEVDPKLTFAEWWRSTKGIPEEAEPAPQIVQIKGKQNRAPKEEYLPFVQDFVKSGQWSDVGDLQNTGLYRLDKDFLGEAANKIPRGETSGMFLPFERQEMLLKAMESKLLPERGYITEQEYEDALKAVAPPPTPGPTMEFLREMSGMPPEDGMAHGGRVHISDNPDVMQLELAGGGLVKGLKAAAKAVKGTQDVLPAAEREANKAKFLEPSAVKERVYHGTGADISEFNPSVIGAMGPGTYVTTKPKTASHYSDVVNHRRDKNNPNVLPLNIQIKNPFPITNVNRSGSEFFLHFDPTGKLSDAEVIELAKKAGYDAVHALEDGEINVFDPRRIKSAIGNRGTYDIEDPDITKAEGGAVHMQAGGLAKAAKALKAAKEAPMKASEALGRIEGRPLVITQADRTKVGGGFLGGPGFSGLQLEDPAYRAAEAAWGVKTPGVAKMILGGGKAAGKDPVYAAMLGTPTQHQSNQMVFDKLYGDFKKSAKKGNLDPDLRDRINMRLANTVDKEGNPIFPSDVDILGKNFKELANTFDRRAVTANLIGGMGVGGKKGQIIDYDKIIRETTDPLLIDAPTGALGNRLFTLSGGIIERPDLHPAFPTILQGEDLGVSFDPVARELIMKDFMERTMREKGRAPGYMDFTRGYPPSQLITEDLLTELQKLGLKEGGAVHKAAGGEITADDLILEERKL